MQIRSRSTHRKNVDNFAPKHSMVHTCPDSQKVQKWKQKGPQTMIAQVEDKRNPSHHVPKTKIMSRSHI